MNHLFTLHAQRAPFVAGCRFVAVRLVEGVGVIRLPVKSMKRMGQCALCRQTMSFVSQEEEPTLTPIPWYGDETFNRCFT